MPPDSIWATLGVAAPLVAILYYLLRQATEERKDTTKQFLSALTTTVAQSTEAMRQLQEASRAQAANVTAEHLRIIAALQAIAESVAAESRRIEAIEALEKKRESKP